MIYEFIDKHRSEHAVERMCRILGVTRSGYYGWLRHGQSRRALRDAVLLEKVRESHRQSSGRYGSPNIHKDLCDWDYRCSPKRVARLMRQAGLRSKTKRRFRVTTESRHTMPVAANLLQRNFSVSVPGKTWLSDITYLWTRQGWLYLCVILDLWDRKVVGWHVSKGLGAELVVHALQKAVLRRRPVECLVFHSDRGIQYCSETFRAELRRHGMLQSMSRKGDCWDNAVAESFCGTLKRELIYHERYEAWSGILTLVTYSDKRAHFNKE